MKNNQSKSNMGYHKRDIFYLLCSTWIYTNMIKHLHFPRKKSWQLILQWGILKIKSYVIPQWSVMDLIFKITTPLCYKLICIPFSLQAKNMVSLKLSSTTLLSLKQSETHLWLLFQRSEDAFCEFLSMLPAETHLAIPAPKWEW